MPQCKPLPDLSVVRQKLHYDPSSGLWTNTITDKPTGWVARNGYRYLSLAKRELLAHRLAWLWVYEQDPVNSLIDHIDGNKLNNSIDNLRLTDYSGNIQNSRCRCAVGLKGVYRNGVGYSAKIKFKGTQHYLGTFTTPELAHEAYTAKARELFGEFASARSN